MKHAQTEAGLGAHVVAWLSSMELEVFQEVTARGARADIVVLVGPRIWTIELKASFGLDVLAQANDWLRRGLAHTSSIAVPSARMTGGRALGLRIADDLGLGVIEVGGRDSVRELVRPRARRAPQAPTLRSTLRPEHKTALPAGSAGGGYWTPFRTTCADLRRVVESRPGVSMADAIKGMSHHYGSARSARSCLLRWAEEGKVEGVELRRDGRKVTLWPTDPKSTT